MICTVRVNGKIDHEIFKLVKPGVYSFKEKDLDRAVKELMNSGIKVERINWKSKKTSPTGWTRPD